MRASLAALERRDDVEVIGIEPPAAASLAWWRQTTLVKQCAGRADLIHSWTSAFPLRAPVPVVQTVHEAPWCHGAVENAGPAHRLWARAGRSRAALVVTPSPLVAADLGHHSKLRVIPWGVDPAFSPERSAADDELLNVIPGLTDRPFALCLGGTRPKKRLDLLLAGIAAFNADSSADLGVVCTGPPTPEAQALEAAHPHLLLAGVLEERLIPAVVRAAACTSVLSTSEGFGLPAIESLGAGTPVLVARGTVQAETAAGYGIEVDPESPASVASGLETALQEAGSNPRREDGLAHARTMTWERTAESLVAAWRSLL